MNGGRETEAHRHMCERTQGDIRRRLNLIEGQIGGMRRMIEDDRPCVDVLVQVASVRQAVRQVGRIVLQNHLQTCVTRAIAERNDEILNELLAVLDRYNQEG